MADFSNALTDFGGAVSDLFSSRAARTSAGSYGEAADVARENALLTEQATAIKRQQLTRQIYQTIGTQKSQVGGAGFAESGSALDILRSSASQGAMTKAINEEQGAITANAYREQAAQFDAMKNAAKTSALGSAIGGALDLAGAGFNLSGALGGGAAGGAGGAGTAALPAGAADLADLAVLA